MMLIRMVRGVIAAAKVVGIDPARPVNGQVGNLRAQPFEEPAGFDDRGVLDPRGDDVVALVAQREERALEGKVVGFAAAAGEEDLVVAGNRAARPLGRAPSQAPPWP